MGVYFSLEGIVLGFADTNTLSFLSPYTTCLTNYNYQYFLLQKDNYLLFLLKPIKKLNSVLPTNKTQMHRVIGLPV